MNDRTSYLTSIVSFLAGAVTGATLALLLAPLSGGDTRERIGGKLRDAADGARDLTDRVGSAFAGHRPRKTPGNGDEVAAI